MADRIIGERGEADHGVVTGAVPRFDVPHVDPRTKADFLGPRTEVATLVEAQVQTLHRVPGRPQERNQDGADIAAITCDENPHSQ